MRGGVGVGEGEGVFFVTWVEQRVALLSKSLLLTAALSHCPLLGQPKMERRKNNTHKRASRLHLW